MEEQLIQPIKIFSKELEYRPITQDMVPYIKPWYSISNYGDVYSSKSNKILSPGTDTKGYKYVALSTYNGPVNQRIHRLVMLAFNNDDGQAHNYIGNHFDGNKSNNCAWNIERATYSTNAYHAYSILKRQGGAKSKIPEEDIIKICELLEQGFEAKDIINYIGNPDITQDIIYSITSRKAHINISSKYNFKSKSLLSDSDIKNLCAYFENNKELINQLNTPHKKHDFIIDSLNYANIEISRSTIDIANRVLRKASFKKITSNYDY